MNIDVKTQNIHNQACFDDIDAHVRSTITLLDVVSDMDDIVEFIEEYVVDVSVDYKIDQMDIMADGRNNKYSNIKNGIFIIDVYYKHINCYNVTRLTYTVTR